MTMADYGGYIKRLVEEKVELLAARGYFHNSPEQPAREQNLRETIYENIGDCLIIAVIKPGPQTFEIATQENVDGNQKTDFSFQFHFDHERKFLEIAGLEIKMADKRNSFQLMSSYDLPSADMAPSLIETTQLVRKIIQDPRIIGGPGKKSRRNLN